MHWEKAWWEVQNKVSSCFEAILKLTPHKTTSVQYLTSISYTIYVSRRRHAGEALCGWAAKADDSFVCFGAKPDKGFLDLKSRRIRKWEGDANESWRRDPDERSWRWTAERRANRVGVEPRTGAVNIGHRSREARQHGIGSSDSESRWVCIPELCGIFASNPH